LARGYNGLSTGAVAPPGQQAAIGAAADNQSCRVDVRRPKCKTGTFSGLRFFAEGTAAELRASAFAGTRRLRLPVAPPRKLLRCPVSSGPARHFLPGQLSSLSRAGLSGQDRDRRLYGSDRRYRAAGGVGFYRPGRAPSLLLQQGGDFQDHSRSLVGGTMGAPTKPPREDVQVNAVQADKRASGTVNSIILHPLRTDPSPTGPACFGRASVPPAAGENIFLPSNLPRFSLSTVSARSCARRL